ncbi:MAG TPA: bifunctional isocitrate dehydrogenase kinase/phosphatase, partial [Candidatus Dormibacteraeota bacterium]|nr:bifunctional isocitrate dehydrogenase kinase/phosphatase [Candidatus Dormibacteraeota bacterium]
MARQPSSDLSASRLSNRAATAIAGAHELYREDFEKITRRAKARFQRRDWQGAVEDAAERLDLYGQMIDRTEREVRAVLGDRVADGAVWAGTKAVYSGTIAGRDDWELAETFFNSVTRRIFTTVGVHPEIEFVDSDFEPPRLEAAERLCRTYQPVGEIAELIERVLGDFSWDVPYADLGADAVLAAGRIAAQLRAGGIGERVERAEIIRAPFFRRKGGYILGRLFTADGVVPLALALLNTETGIVVDAALTDEDDISILFSFAQSHFNVDLGPAHTLVRLLKELMPKKPVAELYIALGHHKHGKTELYRDLLRHLRQSKEPFVFAPGIKGLVMVVFTMPGYDVVFKVIRNRIPAIKPITPADVRDKYGLVFRHDRAGRLVEAQEFEHLEFDRGRFAADLVDEFTRDAGETIAVTDDDVIVHHSYIERRVTPLDLYLREAAPEDARRAVVDFGQAIKDLAANGIFPGELLPKNFGVTRHGRVICYDYDELSLLTDFTFREMP